MKREEIQFSKQELEWFALDFDDCPDEEYERLTELYYIVDIETLYTDIEKGYEKKRMIIERRADQKYFAITYMDSTYNGYEFNNTKAKEVFKVERTIVQISYE